MLFAGSVNAFAADDLTAQEWAMVRANGQRMRRDLAALVFREIPDMNVEQAWGILLDQGMIQDF